MKKPFVVVALKLLRTNLISWTVNISDFKFYYFVYFIFLGYTLPFHTSFVIHVPLAYVCVCVIAVEMLTLVSEVNSISGALDSLLIKRSHYGD